MTQTTSKTFNLTGFFEGGVIRKKKDGEEYILFTLITTTARHEKIECCAFGDKYEKLVTLVENYIEEDTQLTVYGQYKQYEFRNKKGDIIKKQSFTVFDVALAKNKIPKERPL